jgi:PEP-CTERM motif
MKIPYQPWFASLALMASASFSSAATVIYTDNFNVADTNSLDGSDQTGRHTGIVANDVLARSGGAQMAIASNQVVFTNGFPVTGIVRLTDLSASTQYNFAAGTSGAAISVGGGFRFEFDWTPSDNTSDDWISFSTGYTSFEENVRVNNGTTDFGVLLRNNGGSVFFDNGGGTTGANYNVSMGAVQHHATIDFTFGSFADGSAVTAKTYVDSLLLGTQNFTWDGNGGVLNMEFGNIGVTKQLDNISISAIPEPSSMALMGLTGLALAVRRRKSH